MPKTENLLSVITLQPWQVDSQLKLSRIMYHWILKPLKQFGLIPVQNLRVGVKNDKMGVIFKQKTGANMSFHFFLNCTIAVRCGSLMWMTDFLKFSPSAKTGVCITFPVEYLVTIRDRIM